MEVSTSYLLHCLTVFVAWGRIPTFSYYVFSLQWCNRQHRWEDPCSEGGWPCWVPGELLQWSSVIVIATLEGVLPRLRYCAEAPWLVFILGFLWRQQREIHSTGAVHCPLQVTDLHWLSLASQLLLLMLKVQALGMVGGSSLAFAPLKSTAAKQAKALSVSLCPCLLKWLVPVLPFRLCSGANTGSNLLHIQFVNPASCFIQTRVRLLLVYTSEGLG